MGAGGGGGGGAPGRSRRGFAARAREDGTGTSAPNDPTLRSFIAVAPASDFPIQNLPYGVFSARDGLAPRVGVAIGDYVLDLWAARTGLPARCRSSSAVFAAPSLNPFMALGPKVWSQHPRADQRAVARTTIRSCATTRSCASARWCRWRMSKLHHADSPSPAITDFYSSKEHATNVGVDVPRQG